MKEIKNAKVLKISPKSCKTTMTHKISKGFEPFRFKFFAFIAFSVYDILYADDLNQLKNQEQIVYPILY